jgi:hypothetical protein
MGKLFSSVYKVDHRVEGQAVKALDEKMGKHKDLGASEIEELALLLAKMIEAMKNRITNRTAEIYRYMEAGERIEARKIIHNVLREAEQAGFKLAQRVKSESREMKPNGAVHSEFTGQHGVELELEA